MKDLFYGGSTYILTSQGFKQMEDLGDEDIYYIKDGKVEHTKAIKVEKKDIDISLSTYKPSKYYPYRVYSNKEALDYITLTPNININSITTDDIPKINISVGSRYCVISKVQRLVVSWLVNSLATVDHQQSVADLYMSKTTKQITANFYNALSNIEEDLNRKFLFKTPIRSSDICIHHAVLCRRIITNPKLYKPFIEALQKYFVITRDGYKKTCYCLCKKFDLTFTLIFLLSLFGCVVGTKFKEEGSIRYNMIYFEEGSLKDCIPDTTPFRKGTGYNFIIPKGGRLILGTNYYNHLSVFYGNGLSI